MEFFDDVVDVPDLHYAMTRARHIVIGAAWQGQCLRRSQLTRIDPERNGTD